MKEHVQSFRQMAINLLDDGDGISKAGYCSMQTVAHFVQAGCCDDIWAATQSSEGKCYLPEDHGITA